MQCRGQFTATVAHYILGRVHSVQCTVLLECTLCTMCTLLVECSEGWVRGFFWSSVGRGETGTRVSLTMVLGMLALIVMMMMVVVLVNSW